jgi:hypothetical protein
MPSKPQKTSDVKHVGRAAVLAGAACGTKNIEGQGRWHGRDDKQHVTHAF